MCTTAEEQLKQQILRASQNSAHQSGAAGVRRLAKNKHTGRTAWIISIETVSNPPITVYVLDDEGKQERWKSDEFFANWLTA